MKVTVFRRISNRILHPGIGWIWCLHRVVPERSPFKSNRDLEITPDYLEDLIKEKRRKGFHFVALDTFVEAALRTPWKRKLIHVTFDDGFADVFQYAYPILKKYSIPFTLYVSTGMPDGSADLWWLQLEQMANGDEKWFERTIGEIYRQGTDISAAMHALTGSVIDHSLCRQSSLTWEQLRIMVSDGLCTIGSHGVSHSAISLLSKEAAMQELLESKRRLREMLDVEVHHFSYPHSMFNKATQQLVWESGYRTAVVGYGGQTRFMKGKKFFNREFIVQP